MMPCVHYVIKETKKTTKNQKAMTDKEKIIQEIERRIHFLDGMVNTDFGRGSLDTLNKVLNFIHSIPAEEPSEDLKKAAEEYASMSQIAYKGIHCTYVDDQHAFIAGADWQKEQMMKGLCYETKVYRDEEGDGIDTPIESWLALENNEITNLPNIGLKDGDKVKVIIVKEDEQ